MLTRQIASSLSPRSYPCPLGRVNKRPSLPSALSLGILVVLSCLLSACQWHSPEDDFIEYAARVARVLDVDPPKAPKVQAASLPDKRTVRLTIPRRSIGLIDSYTLRACGLFQLIAQKNASLGKVQDAFRDFDYQTQFLATLTECQQSPALSQAQVNLLDNIKQQKHRDIMAHFHNLLVGSDAMRQQLSASSWYQDSQAHYFDDVKHAWQTLTHIHLYLINNQVAQLAPTKLTAFQEALDKSQLIGRLTYSLQRSADWLDITSQLLNSNQGKIVCGAQRDTTRITRLNNVLHRYYAPTIQSYTAVLNRAYLNLSPFLEPIRYALTDVQVMLPLDKAFNQFKQANLAHVQAWKNTQQHCQPLS